MQRHRQQALRDLPVALLETITLFLSQSNVGALQCTCRFFRKKFLVVKFCAVKLRVVYEDLLPVVRERLLIIPCKAPRLNIVTLQMESVIRGHHVKTTRLTTIVVRNQRRVRHLRIQDYVRLRPDQFNMAGTAEIGTAKAGKWKKILINVYGCSGIADAFARTAPRLCAISHPGVQKELGNFLNRCTRDSHSRLEALALPYMFIANMLRDKILRCGALHDLDLSSTDFADISPLGGLTALRTLNLAGSCVTDESTPGGTCEALVAQPVLTSLNVSNTHLSRMEVFATKKWHLLNITDTDISVSSDCGLEAEILLAGHPTRYDGYGRLWFFPSEPLMHPRARQLVLSEVRRDPWAYRNPCQICATEPCIMAPRAPTPSRVPAKSGTSQALEIFSILSAKSVRELYLANPSFGKNRRDGHSLPCQTSLRSLTIETSSLNLQVLKDCHNLRELSLVGPDVDLRDAPIRLKHIRLANCSFRNHNALQYARSFALIDCKTLFTLDVAGMKRLRTLTCTTMKVYGTYDAPPGPASLHTIVLSGVAVQSDLNLPTAAPQLRTFAMHNINRFGHGCTFSGAHSQTLGVPSLRFVDARGTLLLPFSLTRQFPATCTVLT
jgi:hypothetical protein